MIIKHFGRMVLLALILLTPLMVRGSPCWDLYHHSNVTWRTVPEEALRANDLVLDQATADAIFGNAMSRPELGRRALAYMRTRIGTTQEMAELWLELVQRMRVRTGLFDNHAFVGSDGRILFYGGTNALVIGQDGVLYRARARLRAESMPGQSLFWNADFFNLRRLSE